MQAGCTRPIPYMTADSFVNTLAVQLACIQGVQAVVLGGSRAQGTHTPASDFDIGIYYHPNTPLDWQSLNALASQCDDYHRPALLCLPGGWGPWVNGGGWLQMHGQAVDWIYRDLQHVTQVISDCLTGRVQIAYQPGHPHGFVSAIYAGEVAHCQILWAANDQLSTLKAALVPYPAVLGQALIDLFGWEVQFALQNAQKALARADNIYVAGCCYRAVSCLLQVIFARNGQYCLNEKGAAARAAGFAIVPKNLYPRLQRVFAACHPDTAQLTDALRQLADLAVEVLP